MARALWLTFSLLAAATLPVPAAAQSIVASVLPISRSVPVNTAATAFATIINATAGPAACLIALPPALAGMATFGFQTTDPLTNQATGSPNVPATIPPGGSQTFLISITPTVELPPTDVALVFNCGGAGVAQSITGINTLLLSASSTPTPDIVALAATLNNDGIASTRGPTGPGVFAVATVNVGTSGSITVTTDFGDAAVPLGVSLCQTNPASGVCTTAVGPTVTTTIGALQTPTFAFFLTGGASIPFDPARNRLFVRFRDAGGVVRGATSVAVRTVGDLTGVWVGSGSETQIGCSNAASNGTFALGIALDFASQTGEFFAGTATISMSIFGTPSVNVVSFSGTLDVAEQPRGAFTFTNLVNNIATASGTGSFTSSRAGNTLGLSFTGRHTAGDTCAFTGSGVVNKR